jgi:hypothetical protein
VFDDLPLKAEQLESAKAATLIDAPSSLALEDSYLIGSKAKQSPLTGAGYSTEKPTSFVATESNAKTFNAFRAATEDSTISNPKVKATFNC